MNKLFFLITLLVLASCSISPIRNVNYAQYNAYSSNNPGNMICKEIGPVISGQSGSILKSCHELAQLALAELLGNAKSMGGNAVINIQWEKDGEISSMPHCETKYGWAFLYGVGLFTPWVRDVKVTGTAVKLENKPNIKTPGTQVLLIRPISKQKSNSFYSQYLQL